MARNSGTDGLLRWTWVQLLFGSPAAEVTSGNPLPVAVISTVAVEYTEDAAAASDPVGPLGMLVAVDTPATRVADGDNVASIGTRKGEQRVAAKLQDANYTDLTFYSEPNATSRIVSAAASTNATSAKASAGHLFQASGYNANAAARYLKIYNKASAPTVGTDTPRMTKYLPPTSAFVFDWPDGYSLDTGIAYALTTGSADADTGALTAADVLAFNLDYS